MLTPAFILILALAMYRNLSSDLAAHSADRVLGQCSWRLHLRLYHAGAVYRRSTCCCVCRDDGRCALDLWGYGQVLVPDEPQVCHRLQKYDRLLLSGNVQEPFMTLVMPKWSRCPLLMAAQNVLGYNPDEI